MGQLCFQVLAIMINGAVSILGYAFCWVIEYVYIDFSRFCQMVFLNGCPVYVPTSKLWTFQLLILPDGGYCFPFPKDM